MNQQVSMLLVSLLAGCTEIAATEQEPLAGAASELAVQLGDSSFRAELQSLIAERGDHELLVDDARLVDGTAFREHLAASGVADLQIAAPLGWSEDTIPLVTFVLDEDAPTMEYFAPDGSSFTRPASERPEVPVLVLGPRDRTDREVPQKEDATAQLTAVALHLRAIYLTDTHEPWHKGNAEIYVSCAMYGSENGTGVKRRTLAKQWIDQADETYKWYTLNRHLTDFRSDETYVVCKVMEADSDSLDDFVGHAVFGRDELISGTGTSCVFDFYEHADLGASDVAASTTAGPFGPIPVACSNYWHN